MTVEKEAVKKKETKPVDCIMCRGKGVVTLNIPSRSFYHTIEYSQKEGVCQTCKGSGLNG